MENVLSYIYNIIVILSIKYYNILDYLKKTFYT